MSVLTVTKRVGGFAELQRLCFDHRKARSRLVEARSVSFDRHKA